MGEIGWFKSSQSTTFSCYSSSPLDTWMLHAARCPGSGHLREAMTRPQDGAMEL